MPRVVVLLTGGQPPLVLAASAGERQTTKTRAHRVTHWCLSHDRLPSLLGQDHLPFRVVQNTEGLKQNNWKHKCGFVLRRSKQFFATQWDLHGAWSCQGWGVPGQLRAVKTVTEELWTTWAVTCTHRNDVSQPIPLSGAYACGKLNTFCHTAPTRWADVFAMHWAPARGTDPSHVLTPLWQAWISLTLSFDRGRHQCGFLSNSSTRAIALCGILKDSPVTGV